MCEERLLVVVGWGVVAIEATVKIKCLYMRVKFIFARSHAHPKKQNWLGFTVGRSLPATRIFQRGCVVTD